MEVEVTIIKEESIKLNGQKASLRLRGTVFWRIAMDAGLQSLLEAGTVTPVIHVPKGAEELPSKAVFALKNDLNRTTKLGKTRAVICGNFQNKSPWDLL